MQPAEIHLGKNIARRIISYALHTKHKTLNPNHFCVQYSLLFNVKKSMHTYIQKYYYIKYFLHILRTIDF